ncbi:MAG: ABC transporter ATP-binding protein [Gammaproteobacteria bacterium]|nr:MAG: ABC transporter ATP-binding protein [Gammaproteobacteria bacterium]
MALIELVDTSLNYGDAVLADRVNLTVQPGERICLIGRNGAGKTTLLRVIAGELEPDAGERRVQRGVRVKRLGQEAPDISDVSVYDVVAEGLGEAGRLLAQYHDASLALAADASDGQLKKLERLQHQLDVADAWNLSPRIEAVLSRMELEPDQPYSELSGGQRRRVMLAQALVDEPEVLLLDEPTNHLDIEAIQWLETFMLEFPGTLIFITHDRAFLQKLATRIIELDRGYLTSWDCDYATYLVRKEEALAAEQQQNAEFDKKLAREESWIRQGIKARRTRNEGRVRALKKLREESRARREKTGKANIRLQSGERSGKLVAEIENVRYAWDDKLIVKDFSTTIQRGDKIGIIGPNGSGKTTLIRLMLGELQPQSGLVKLGSKLETVYFDQHRSALDESKSVVDVVSGGRESVTINGRSKHIMGYLKDFLFDPKRARQPVSSLSGGERNRLMLARLFTRPANLLVMDEPTNDLDLETLELLEEILVNFSGTLLLISHDRAFIDNVVTSTLVLEGNGRVGEYVGGYEDMLRQRKPQNRPASTAPVANKPATAGAGGSTTISSAQRRELQALPGKIERLEQEQANLHASMADPAFYQQPASKVEQVQRELRKIEQKLSDSYARWERLEQLSG